VQFLVPFLMAIRRSFEEFKVFSFSSSSLSVVLGSKLGLNSWTCHTSGMLFIIV